MMHSRDGKGKHKLAVIAAFILLLVVLYQLSASRQASPIVSEDEVMSAESQWRELLELGEQIIGDKISGTVKWQGSWGTLLDPEEAANVLTTRLGLPAAEQGMLQNHTVYSSSGSRDEFALHLNVTRISSSEYYVVLRLEGEGRQAMSSLSEQQALLGQSLLDEGITAEWNAAVQGMRKQPDELERGSLKEALDGVEKQFPKKLDLTLVEQYEDQDTISRTYYSAYLPISVDSGGQKVGLQAALHIHSVTGEQEVSLGSPLLTIEY
ncbi:YwmB family TATA-box binding protein [Paenibacillus sp. MSJ-6]|uniref:YwmB family TATA-box binding protein n=2 Tax=Paenibacillus brevis TaxID=2841508 RepID=A0ABS6FSR3_9BACL|nr:YwmB family TATA-box binding protein [Paenibacillus brevis]